MLQNLLIEFASLSAGIYALTEILHHRVRLSTDLLSLLIGVTLALLLCLAGFFNLPGEALWQDLLGAALLGLIATAVANKTHDWIIKPAKDSINPTGE